MFTKILIANRGAIATRIIRTLKQMGCQSVAVFNEADADSLHVQHADESYSLGEGRAADTYLNQDKIFEIIKQADIDAVHPGYGFLSENPDFVKRCEANGVVFIGPTTDQMLSFGLKHTARQLAEDNNIPLLPGTGLLENITQALSEARSIGYPLMLKSTAGGGGIGMQLCWNEDELKQSYDSVRRLSENNFSNSGVFIEKFIEYARHIEVQVFGDGEGKACAIGERDCSTQRRNQKVIEETPAPNLTDDVRKKLHETAVRLIKAVNYRNAGTVEFVYDQKLGQFYFLEVNTRLQVEHGVTEQVFNIDLVEWMIKLAAQELDDVDLLASKLKLTGHAIQARIYAEDPNKNFQPCAGQLSDVFFPAQNNLRIDHWIETGIEVSPLFDPMLAKIVITEKNRASAIQQLDTVLAETVLYGIETNVRYVREILNTDIFQQGDIYTRYLDSFVVKPNSIDIISGGTLTTIQDYPARTGYWNIGVPPSGPFDQYSFNLGNRLLNNNQDAAGLEITLNGPSLKFNNDTQIILTGAAMDVWLDNNTIAFWRVINITAGQTLKIGKANSAGARAYLCLKGGIACPDYLGSKSTFTLGQFGGHAGRALRAGDVLHFNALDSSLDNDSGVEALSFECPNTLIPEINNTWQLHVVYGPHGAPDFFTDEGIKTFFSAEWEVHYNSSRTGIRLVGPKPEWARSDGGEAGMHPSNIHDNAYAIGTVDFTGDMPVILGPDGPSLGGFVCPATVISADLWKLGQLKAGDKIKFISVSIDNAVVLEKAQLGSIKKLKHIQEPVIPLNISSAIYKTIDAQQHGVKIVYRPSGDKYLLIEFGALKLDIELRFRVHALMLSLQENPVAGVLELTPGIRSLQLHYDSQCISLNDLVAAVDNAIASLKNIDDLDVPARIVHIPLSWDDDACQQAIEKYMQSVRKDAPWCPDNIEFIRRINGLDNVQQVKDIVFDASYLVMGLGDVYLGAPVATPIDPRHRLVTTKYNPARTWTAENSVGIGGSYLCVYGMEGPGGYQFVGRTLQMWNRYNKTKEFEQPWLLRFFDQIKFYEVSAQELKIIRRDFPKGRYSIKIEETRFNLKNYLSFLQENESGIQQFTAKRKQAFDEELQRWIESGQMNFESAQDLIDDESEEENLPDGCAAIESPVAGNVWKMLVKPGDKVEEHQTLAILESMKMEIAISATHSGVVHAINRGEGSQVNAGQTLLVLQMVS
ncbi:Urea carboxylase [hydrothermal vent metagenome]|uniref:Urea carboxylase n=1 Tax=hydrothermal vent metagenome TaxID=652676 RepID=A0A3B0X9A2_9ZZZZ